MPQLVVPDLELAKIRLKCLEIAASGDPTTTMRRAAQLAAWVVRDRTARSDTSPASPPPALPERLASFRLGMEEMERRLEAAGVKPSVLDKIKSTLSLDRKNK
jgi:hypothetical protein